jgi:hypothetical protein
VNAPSAGPMGSVFVDVKSKSQFLTTSLPFEVRDAYQAVVKRGLTGSAVPLSEGLYSVAVVTAEGQRATEVVQVRSAQTTRVTFEDAEPPENPPEFEDAEPPENSPEFENAGPPENQPDSPPPAGPISLTSLHGCVVRSSHPTGWEFAPSGPLHEVPTAGFRIGSRYCTMSLPLNPAKDRPLDACTVEVVTTGDQPGLRMAFAPGRRVSRMVEGLLRSRELAAGSDVLDQASDLLLQKYSDPPGAALGALTLHRIGLLTEKRSWMENLSQDFMWLPDGSILLAALLRESLDQSERRRGLSLLLSAAEKRPMYTDGLSLALELLRRWPDDPSRSQRKHLVNRLAIYAAYADWNAINLTVLSD